MRAAPDDDLFRESTMTFGEHLEELRTALWKSVVAISIGFCIGMYFASWFVNQVKAPLQEAINRYMEQKDVFKPNPDELAMYDRWEKWIEPALPEDPEEAT